MIQMPAPPRVNLQPINVQGFSPGAQMASVIGNLAPFLMDSYLKGQQRRTERDAKTQLADLLAESMAPRDQQNVVANQQAFGPPVVTEQVAPTQAEIQANVLRGMLASENPLIQEMGVQRNLDRIFAAPTEKWTPTYSPYGRKGFGQVSSTTGKVENYQPAQSVTLVGQNNELQQVYVGSPEYEKLIAEGYVEDPTKQRPTKRLETVNIGGNEVVLQENLETRSWEPFSIGGVEITAPRWQETAQGRTIEFQQGDEIVTWISDPQAPGGYREIGRGDKWQARMPDTVTVQEGEDNVTYRVNQDGSRDEIGRGRKWQAPGQGSPTIKSWNEGGDTVTSQWNPAAKEWVEVGRAPRWAEQAPNVISVQEGDKLVYKQWDDQAKSWKTIADGPKWQKANDSQREQTIQDLINRGKTRAEAEDIVDNNIRVIAIPGLPPVAYNTATNKSWRIGNLEELLTDVERSGDSYGVPTIFDDLSAYGGAPMAQEEIAGIPLVGKPLNEWLEENFADLGFSDAEKVVRLRANYRLIRSDVLGAYSQSARVPVIEQQRILENLPKMGFLETPERARGKLVTLHAQLMTIAETEEAYAKDWSNNSKLREDAGRTAKRVRSALSILGNPPADFSSEDIATLNLQQIQDIVDSPVIRTMDAGTINALLDHLNTLGD